MNILAIWEKRRCLSPGLSKLITLVAVLSLVVLGTQLIRLKNLQTALEQSSSEFASHQLPANLLDSLGTKQVLVLGETHYVQEHQELVSKLVQQLHPAGYRVFLNEGMHALSWIAEDYALGLYDQVPPSLAMFDQYWLREIRDYNLTLPADKRITFQLIDMNHWPDVFYTSVSLITQHLKTGGFFDELLSTDILSPDYGMALENALSKLQANSSYYRILWSDKWVDRISEMLTVELVSLGIRNQWSSAKREELMISLFTQRAEEAAGKVIVNCGMNHGQKKYFPGMGPGGDYLLLGEHIAANYLSYHIAFWGITGNRRDRFFDKGSYVLKNNWYSWDLLHLASNHLTNPKIVSLEAPVFTRPTIVNNRLLQPSRQYDAYILYPEISLLNSLQVYYP